MKFLGRTRSSSECSKGGLGQPQGQESSLPFPDGRRRGLKHILRQYLQQFGKCSLELQELKANALVLNFLKPTGDMLIRYDKNGGTEMSPGLEKLTRDPKPYLPFTKQTCSEDRKLLRSIFPDLPVISETAEMPGEKREN